MRKILTNRHISDEYDKLNNALAGYYNETTDMWNDTEWGNIEEDRRLNHCKYWLNTHATSLNKDDNIFDSLSDFFNRYKI